MTGLQDLIAFFFTTLSTSKALKYKMDGFYYLNVLISLLFLEIIILNLYTCSKINFLFTKLETTKGAV